MDYPNYSLLNGLDRSAKAEMPFNLSFQFVLSTPGSDFMLNPFALPLFPRKPPWRFFLEDPTSDFRGLNLQESA
jgi:hypothetical protein